MTANTVARLLRAFYPADSGAEINIGARMDTPTGSAYHATVRGGNVNGSAQWQVERVGRESDGEPIHIVLRQC